MRLCLEAAPNKMITAEDPNAGKPPQTTGLTSANISSADLPDGPELQVGWAVVAAGTAEALSDGDLSPADRFASADPHPRVGRYTSFRWRFALRLPTREDAATDSRRLVYDCLFER